jgi:hypothetical protein
MFQQSRKVLLNNNDNNNNKNNNNSNNKNKNNNNSNNNNDKSNNKYNNNTAVCTVRNTTSSCSGDTRITSAHTPCIVKNVFVAFLSPSRKIPELWLKRNKTVIFKVITVSQFWRCSFALSCRACWLVEANDSENRTLKMESARSS